MANSLSEGFFRVTLQNEFGVHHVQHTINFVGEPVQGELPTLTQKDGTSIAADAGIVAFLTEYAKFYSDDTDFGLVEIYKVNADTEERSFIYGWNVDMTGSAVTSNVKWGMLTMTFKTTKGGILRVVMMEGVTAINQNVFPPYTVDTPPADLTAYLISGDSVIVGRDDAYIFGAISHKSKTSDALRDGR